MAMARDTALLVNCMPGYILPITLYTLAFLTHTKMAPEMLVAPLVMLS
jgi:hypothetical protein